MFWRKNKKNDEVEVGEIKDDLFHIKEEVTRNTFEPEPMRYNDFPLERESEKPVEKPKEQKDLLMEKIDLILMKLDIITERLKILEEKVEKRF